MSTFSRLSSVGGFVGSFSLLIVKKIPRHAAVSGLLEVPPMTESHPFGLSSLSKYPFLFTSSAANVPSTPVFILRSKESRAWVLVTVGTPPMSLGSVILRFASLRRQGVLLSSMLKVSTIAEVSSFACTMFSKTGNTVPVSTIINSMPVVRNFFIVLGICDTLYPIYPLRVKGKTNKRPWLYQGLLLVKVDTLFLFHNHYYLHDKICHKLG